MNFLKRLFGGDPEREKKEEERFKANLKKLDEQKGKLDELDAQIECVDQAAKAKQKKIGKTTIDFTKTMSRSITPPDMPAVAKESDDRQDEERISGELTPSGAHG